MKFIILGLSHQGTCSLEKYLVEQGHEVIRSEDFFRVYTPDRYHQLYTEYIPLLIWSDKKTDLYDTESIITEWIHAIPELQVLQLEEMAEKDGFPWENKGDCLSKAGIRPDYSSLRDKGTKQP